MAIVINGSGTVTGLAVGGLPDGTVDAGTLATNSVDSAELIDGAVDDSHIGTLAASKLTGALPAISGANLTGISSGLSSQHISFTRNSASGAGTQAISGVGFQPTAVLFLASISGAGMASIGYQDSDRAKDALADRHLMTANDWDSGAWNADAINMVFASTVNYGGSITSYDSDGFTITWGVRGSPSGTITVRALCLK